MTSVLVLRRRFAVFLDTKVRISFALLPVCQLLGCACQIAWRGDGMEVLWIRTSAIWHNRQHNWHAGQTLRFADRRQSLSTCRGSVALALSELAFVAGGRVDLKVGFYVHLYAFAPHGFVVFHPGPGRRRR
jgi:hypothetical protein